MAPSHMTASRHGPGDGDDDDPEAEALILHRLDTDPKSGKPRITTIPTHSELDSDDSGIEDGEDDLEGQTDEMLEKRRVKALARQAARKQATAPAADPDAKLGRPRWLQDGMGSFTRLKPLHKYTIIGIALSLLGLVFYLALGSGGTGRIWHYAGDIWTGGGVPYTFPSDVGYPGPTATGSPAKLQEEDKLTGSRPSPYTPIETQLDTAKYGSFNPL